MPVMAVLVFAAETGRHKDRRRQCTTIIENGTGYKQDDKSNEAKIISRYNFTFGDDWPAMETIKR